MKKGVIAWVLIGVGIIAAVIWAMLQLTEPSYKGKRLSVWMAEIDWRVAEGPELETRMVEWLQREGVPYYLRMAKAQDSTSRSWMQKLKGYLAKYKLNFLSTANGQHTVALNMLQKLDVYHYTNVTEIVELLESSDLRVKQFASACLCRIGEPAIPPLVTMLKSPKPEQRQLVMSVLANMRAETGRTVIPILIEASTNHDQMVRHHAVSGLAKFQDKEVIPVMVEALADQDPIFRLMALQWARSLPPSAQEARAAALSKAQKSAQDEDPNIVRTAQDVIEWFDRR